VLECSYPEEQPAGRVQFQQGASAQLQCKCVSTAAFEDENEDENEGRKRMGFLPPLRHLQPAERVQFQQGASAQLQCKCVSTTAFGDDDEDENEAPLRETPLFDVPAVTPPAKFFLPLRALSTRHVYASNCAMHDFLGYWLSAIRRTKRSG
jgi:hypothetical protein